MSKPEIDIKNRDIENDDANHRILCVDDDKAFLYRIKQILKAYHVVTAMTVKQALQVMHNQQIDTVLLDIDLNGESGLDALAQIRKEYPSMDIVMVTGHRNPEFIVKAIKSGARDYVCKPINPPELIACVEKAKRAKEEGERVSALIGELDSVDITSRIVGHSKRFLNLLRTADKVKGHHDANALIMGESGTGKELLARYIHRLEENSKRPFIVVNCAAIPDNLIESELFGYEKGAFTGAIKNKLGKFAIADGGDIFLDEISTLKPQTQAKLLRVLQEKEFCPLGSNNHVKSNFRVIAATNDNLEELVSKGEFRLDLYHRLKIITLTIPPLRERKEDI
ncbi:MAG: sigma-54 dependent transcriptional regulator, partial [Pseudomonadota bacterium]